MNEEEKVLMPAIQRHYSDQEIRERGDFPVYREMTTDEKFYKVSDLFPTVSLEIKSILYKSLKMQHQKNTSRVDIKLGRRLTSKTKISILE